MVCPRCIEAVSLIFKDLGLSVDDIRLGKVSITEDISPDQKRTLKKRLTERGFDLLDDKQTQLINEIKSIIIQEIHYQKEASLINLSSLLAEKLHFDYAYLSRLFSTVEGQTIERFMLNQKIEKGKRVFDL